MAAIHTPSRWGCVLPSVHEQMATLSSVPVVQKPCERSSRGQTETSLVWVKVTFVGLARLSILYWKPWAQPSSEPLPLQPRQATILATAPVPPSDFVLMTKDELASWFIEQSSLV